MQQAQIQTPSPQFERFKAMDFYEMLDVPREASFEAINIAHRRALQVYDPLSVAIYSIISPEEAVLMVELVEKAFKTLRDPVERRKYDKDLEQAQQSSSAQAEIQIAAESFVSGPIQRSFSFLSPVYAVEHSSVAEGGAVISTDLPIIAVEADLPASALSSVPPSPAAAIGPSAEAESKAPMSDIRPDGSPARSQKTDAPKSGRDETMVDGRGNPLPAQVIGGQTAHTNASVKSGLEKSWYVSDSAPAKEITGLPRVEARTEKSPAIPPPIPAEPSVKIEPTVSQPPEPTKEVEEEILLGPDTVYSGNVLRKIRERQKLDLGDIASITRVTRANLQNIENETYNELPALVYVRGYLNLYARVLKLDPKNVASTYIRRMQESETDGKKE